MIASVLTAQAGGDTSDPFESISGFFDSALWSAMSVLLQIFVVLLWLALVYWTYQDARRRIEAPPVVAGCVALSVLIPFLGTIIYLIVRPPEYLDEARERELELLALEQRLGELGDAEGQQIVGRMLAREGMTPGSDGIATARALRQAGVASHDEVRDLDQRLTELEFRLRLLDTSSASASASESPAAARARSRRSRELPDSTTPERDSSGDTGRTGRWRRPRGDQETYE
ncbi:hypothetical protein [Miltoncostaea oceani]|uniref:hypothetical protein n=1 Tax=Miltoncostaea oceani TaxID=2843216 RepID=UPI001C3D1E49|nr:hypothetical protein [Miltoncostaea oceani]